MDDETYRYRFSYQLSVEVLCRQVSNILALPELEQEALGFRIVSFEMLDMHYVDGVDGVRIRLASYPSESARRVIYDVLGFCWNCHGSEGDIVGFISTPRRPRVVRRLYFTHSSPYSDPARSWILLPGCRHYEGSPRVVEHHGS